MARQLHADMSTAVSRQKVRPFFAATFHFARGASPIRLWTGRGNLDFGGNTYAGVATLGKISPISETSETRAVGMTLTLSGVPSNLVNDAVYTDYQGDEVDVYIGMMTDTNTIEGAPYQMFKGLIDNMILDDNGQKTEITVRVETIMVEMNRTRESRYTSEDQNRRFEGDRFFDFIPDLQTKEIKWG